MNDFLTGVDLTPDTILLAPGTISDPVTITASGVGTDDLLIQGAGRESTTLTSGNTGNNYLINLNGSSREITFKDLAILVPENFPNTNAPGSAVQSMEIISNRWTWSRRMSRVLRRTTIPPVVSRTSLTAVLSGM